jgi:hypothetical protein
MQSNGRPRRGDRFASRVACALSERQRIRLTGGDVSAAGSACMRLANDSIDAFTVRAAPRAAMSQRCHLLQNVDKNVWRDEYFASCLNDSNCLAFHGLRSRIERVF